MTRTYSPRYATRFCPGAFWFPLCFRLVMKTVCSVFIRYTSRFESMLGSISTAFVFMFPTGKLESELPTGKSGVLTSHWQTWSPNFPVANLESELATAKS